MTAVPEKDGILKVCWQSWKDAPTRMIAFQRRMTSYTCDPEKDAPARMNEV
jgi:hypothetical protein